MKYSCVFLFFVFSVIPAYSEMYTWEDKDGVHFTENIDSVPKKYRQKAIAEQRGDITARKPIAEKNSKYDTNDNIQYQNKFQPKVDTPVLLNATEKTYSDYDCTFVGKASMDNPSYANAKPCLDHRKAEIAAGKRRNKTYTDYDCTYFGEASMDNTSYKSAKPCLDNREAIRRSRLTPSQRAAEDASKAESAHARENMHVHKRAADDAARSMSQQERTDYSGPVIARDIYGNVTGRGWSDSNGYAILKDNYGNITGRGYVDKPGNILTDIYGNVTGRVR